MSKVGIPPSRLVSCQYCQEQIDSNGTGTWQVVKGWCPIKRYSGNQRGTNNVSLVTWLHLFACANCISKLKAGIPIGQEVLPFFNLETAE